MPDMVETERFFPVKGETPMCSEIRVYICVPRYVVFIIELVQE